MSATIIAFPRLSDEERSRKFFNGSLAFDIVYNMASCLSQEVEGYIKRSEATETKHLDKVTAYLYECQKHRLRARIMLSKTWLETHREAASLGISLVCARESRRISLKRIERHLGEMLSERKLLRLPERFRDLILHSYELSEAIKRLDAGHFPPESKRA